jgi:hypothetical protein
MARSRDTCVDLLVRRPQSGWTGETRAERIVVDPVAQLRELAALADQGLLTEEEYERQRRRVLGP